MDDVVAAHMLLPMCDDSCPSHVPRVKFDKLSNLAAFEVKFDRVVGTNEGIRVTDGTSIVRNDMWDTLCTDSDLADFKQLVSSFFRGNAVDCESAFDVVQKTEIFARFFDSNNVCNSNEVSSKSDSRGLHEAHP
jgi:hypothetical protein